MVFTFLIKLIALLTQHCLFVPEIFVDKSKGDDDKLDMRYDSNENLHILLSSLLLMPLVVVIAKV